MDGTLSSSTCPESSCVDVLTSRFGEKALIVALADIASRTGASPSYSFSGSLVLGPYAAPWIDHAHTLVPHSPRTRSKETQLTAIGYHSGNMDPSGSSMPSRWPENSTSRVGFTPNDVQELWSFPNGEVWQWTLMFLLWERLWRQMIWSPAKTHRPYGSEERAQ